MANDSKEPILSNWEFWISLITGVAFTLTSFYDLKTDVKVQSEQLTYIKAEVEDIKTMIKDKYTAK